MGFIYVYVDNTLKGAFISERAAENFARKLPRYTLRSSRGRILRKVG